MRCLMDSFKQLERGQREQKVIPLQPVLRSPRQGFQPIARTSSTQIQRCADNYISSTNTLIAFVPPSHHSLPNPQPWVISAAKNLRQTPSPNPAEPSPPPLLQAIQTPHPYLERSAVHHEHWVVPQACKRTHRKRMLGGKLRRLLRWVGSCALMGLRRILGNHDVLSFGIFGL
jgi:hypothetical protein